MSCNNVTNVTNRVFDTNATISPENIPSMVAELKQWLTDKRKPSKAINLNEYFKK